MTSETKASRRPRSIGGPKLGESCGPQAKRLASVILEVLAGTRTPIDAAAAVGITLPNYYQVETRALQGLLKACEPRPRGRVRTTASEVASLQKENQRLQRELGRQQALVRASQRAVGVAPPPTRSATGKKGRKRRTTVRALSIVARLNQEQPATPENLGGE